jgi:hypothetical protein
MAANFLLAKAKEDNKTPAQLLDEMVAKEMATAV